MSLASSICSSLVELLLLSPVELTWSGPDHCNRVEEVHEQLEGLVSAEARSKASIRAQARVHADEKGILHLALSIQDHAPRTVEAMTCEGIQEAAALMLALVIDPNLDPPEGEDIIPEPVRDPPPSTPSAPPTSPPGAPQPPSARDGEPPSARGGEPPSARDGELPSARDGEPPSARGGEPPSARDGEPPSARNGEPPSARGSEPPSRAKRGYPRPLRVSLFATAGLGAFVLPKAAAEVGLGVMIDKRRWRVELGGVFWTPSERRIRMDPDIRGRFYLWSIQARGCGIAVQTPIELPLCAAIELGAIHGEGRGDLQPRRQASLWSALSVGPALLWWPGGTLQSRFGLLVRAEGIVALTQPGFSTSPSGDVLFRSREAGMRALGGIVLRLH